MNAGGLPERPAGIHRHEPPGTVYPAVAVRCVFFDLPSPFFAHGPLIVPAEAFSILPGPTPKEGN
jgi:hypothetical protein